MANRPDQNDERRRNHKIRCAGAELQSLDRRENRNRRRDHAVAVKKSRADDAEQDDERKFYALSHSFVAFDQRQERQDAALTVIVCTKNESDVLHGNEDHQRPEGERHDPQYFGCGRRVAGRVQRRGERIERTGADIAEHDAERRERQKRLGVRPRFTVVLGYHSGRPCPPAFLQRRTPRPLRNPSGHAGFSPRP